MARKINKKKLIAPSGVVSTVKENMYREIIALAEKKEGGEITANSLSEILDCSWQTANKIVSGDTTKLLSVTELISIADTLQTKPTNKVSKDDLKNELLNNLSKILKKQLIENGCTNKPGSIDRKLATEILGCTNPYLSKLFQGKANVTVDALVEFFYSLEMKGKFELKKMLLTDGRKSFDYGLLNKVKE